MKRFFWLGCALFLCLVWCGCGDTFRPIIIPNPPVFPNPAAAHTVVAINDNGSVVPGSAMVIDVSGDADVSAKDVGIHPIYAVQQTPNQVLVVNQAVTLSPPPATTSCLVTVPPQPPNQVFNVCPSLTRVNFSGSVIFNTTAITLPIYSGSNFVAVAPSDTLAYVTMPTYPPDPTQPLNIVPSVGVVNTQSNSLVATIKVGNNPVALAVTPDKRKLYVANHDSNSVSGFNTVDRSARTINGSFTEPLWVTARSDNQRVYVLNANGGNAFLSTIDTTSTAGPDTVIGTINGSVIPPLAAYMLYDGNKNRLYIPGDTQLTILDVSQSTPQPLGGSPLTIQTVPPTTRSAQNDPCSATTARSLTVAAVAALPDGTRAYVGAYYEDAVDNVNYICPQVTVIDVASNTVKSSIAVPGFTAYDAFCSPAQSQQSARFRIMMAAGGDSSRVYLSSCDGGMVNIIDTSSDTYILNLPAPVGTRQTIPPSGQNLPQNPVFLFAGP